ncbi:MAG TPA: hypothetical protein P5572_13115, partial [Phycisphaerae bacterium]|nr:hypothetical protein [Phycisphaerae bacterium]
VYLNGTLIHERDPWLTDWSLVSLDERAVKSLRKGENTLAVHCHQGVGGQFIDVGLLAIDR